MRLEVCWASVNNSEMKGMNGILRHFMIPSRIQNISPSWRDKVIGLFLERRKRKRKSNTAGDYLF